LESQRPPHFMRGTTSLCLRTNLGTAESASSPLHAFGEARPPRENVPFSAPFFNGAGGAPSKSPTKSGQAGQVGQAGGTGAARTPQKKGHAAESKMAT